MSKARYELMEDGGGFFGSIPGFEGLWAQGETLEECREELMSTLEDWILFSLTRQQPVPVIDGIDLSVREVA